MRNGERWVYNTSRRRVFSTAGKVLEWMPIYMPPQSWHQLKRLAAKQGVSASMVIEQLIDLADKVSKKAQQHSTL